MESSDIRDHITITQTKLNLTKDLGQRKKIMNQLTILKYKMDIEQIKQKIGMLQKS